MATNLDCKTQCPTIIDSNFEDDELIGLYDHRCVSIVSIVPARCGAFKYQEIVVRDKDVNSRVTKKTLRRRDLVTRPIAPYCNYWGIDNIHTIERDENSFDLMDRDIGKCELFGLLLNSNTTLFEVVTIADINNLYNDGPHQYLDSFIINYDFTSGPQGKYAIDCLFSEYDIYNATVLIVDKFFDVTDRLNITFRIKRQHKSLELLSCDDDLSNMGDDVYIKPCRLDKNYEQVKIIDIIKKYNHDDYRFYVSMGCRVTEPENLIKLHGYVMKSESSLHLNPKQMTCEFIKHILDDSTVAAPEIARVLQRMLSVAGIVDADQTKKKCISDALTQETKMMIGWGGPDDSDRWIDIEMYDDIKTALENFHTDKKWAKYTIGRATHDLLLLLQRQVEANGIIDDCCISDNTIQDFVDNHKLNNKIMNCEVTKRNIVVHTYNEYEAMYPLIGDQQL